MMDGSDINPSLVCEGIVGDGCGGGRIFFVKEEKLFVFDPVTKESLVLLEGIKQAVKVSKSACLITIISKDGQIKLDLSTL